MLGKFFKVAHKHPDLNQKDLYIKLLNKTLTNKRSGDNCRLWQLPGPRSKERVQDPLPPIARISSNNQKQWALANRLRSEQGKTACSLHRWGCAETPQCPECQLEPQDTDHFVLHCPVTAIPGGYESVHEMNDIFFQLGAPTAEF